MTPEAAGLRVGFVLEPAFYIGMIHFPGALSAFDYPRLLQAVNYPPQEPYDETRAKGAEAALQRFLINNGYFQSSVRTETELDQEHQVANISFHVNLNEKADFGSVEVTGLPEDEAAQLEGALHSLRAYLKGAYVKSGRGFNPERLRGATDLIVDRLASSDRLAAEVSVEPPSYDPGTNHASITFQVVPGPIVVARAEGADVSKGTLRRLIPIYEENAFDQDLVTEGERNLVSYFQSKGYFDVKVDSEIVGTPSDISLVYRIGRGDRHRVMEVSIDGNRFFNDERLLALVEVRPAGFLSRGRFSNDLLRRSVDALTTLYRDTGFEEFAVEPRLENRERQLYVTFDITEGRQTIVSSFQMEGNSTLPVNALAPGGLNLAPGMPFSQRMLNKDRDQIVATYLDRGYMNPVFESVITPLPEDPQRLEVRYAIQEGPRVYIASTVNLGAQKTESSFIELISQVRAGQPLSQGELLASESRLYNEGIFDWVNIGSRKPITDQQMESVLVKVHEAKRNSLDYGFGYELSPRTANIPAGTVALPGLPIVGLPSAFKTTQRQFSSPRASVEYARRNMRGKAETLSVSALFARLDQRATLTYTIPHFRSYHWSSLWSLSAERSSENPIYTARLEEFSFQLERPLNAARTQTLLLRHRINRTRLGDLRIPELVLPRDRSVRLSTLSASYVRDTRDRPLDARRGTYQTFDFGLTPRFFGSSANFVRLLGQTAYYRQVRPSRVWASSVRLGLAKSFGGNEVPLSQRYFSGGANSLRGFPFNGAGPQRIVPVCADANDPSTCANITVPVGGNGVFIFNSEARFPIPIKRELGGVVFYDGGNVYDRIGLGRIFREFSNTLGFGLRYETRVGPIRFDVGHNLNPIPGIKATQFFVTLGQAF